MKVKNLILGAGISGLACANAMKARGEEAVIFEAESMYGGLCHSFMVNGFRFDSAVHLSFTTDSSARTFFDKTKYLCHLPIAYNFYHSMWMKHPIINNMYPMNVDEKVECIRSFVERESNVEIKDYEQWLRASYGKVITEKFYDVYTKKYWTVSPKEMSISWIGKRLNSPDLEKLLRGSFTNNTEIDYYAKEMRYPTGNGGFQAFLKPLLRNANVIYNKKCVEIDLEKKYVVFQDGVICYYDNIVSSIPLPILVKCLINAPQKIKEWASELKANSVSLVSIGFRRPDIAKWLWFYIYDEDIMAARVNSPSMKCKENAPEGCCSLQFEIYHNSTKSIDKNMVINNTEYALKKMKLCKEDDILFMDYKLLPYGNVIFYKGMESKRESIKNFLNRFNVKLIGRFGEWDYLWSDQSYLSGWKMGSKI